MSTGALAGSARSEEECPTLARFLARHPDLVAETRAWLAAAAAVRAARGALLPVDEAAQRAEESPAWRQHGAAAASAVDALVTLAGDASPSPSDVRDAVRRVGGALQRLRAASHGFRAGRATRSPQARAGLVAALQEADRCWTALGRAARLAHVRRLPWQLELATHVAPGTPVAALAFDAYDVAGTPAARRPWGERCCLTGAQWTHEDRVRPSLRHRSLDACFHTLAPTAYALVARLRAALPELHRRCPAAGDDLRALVALFPSIAEAQIAAHGSPACERLGLLDLPSLAVSLHNVLLAFAERPLFGVRGAPGELPPLGGGDPAAALFDAREASGSAFGWTTYETVRRRALRLAFALERRGVTPGRRVGILVDGPCPDAHVADFAAVFAGAVSVVLPATLGAADLRDVIARAGIDLLLAHARPLARLRDGSGPDLPVALSLGDAEIADGAGEPLAGGLEDEPPPGWRSAAGIAPGDGILYGDADGVRAAAAAGIPQDGDGDLYTVLWSSGSTGTPHEVPVTRRRWVEEMCSEANLWPLVGVSFQAPWSAADRVAVWRMLTNGGRVGFARAGAGLFADLAALRPTVFDAPPVVWSALWAEYRRAIADPALTPAAIAAVRRRFRARLGGRLGFIATGGAASEPGLRQGISDLLGLPLHDSYGTSESGNLGVDGKLLPELDVRLRDVPELGLHAADRPHPRGELLVRTPRSAEAPVAPGAIALEPDGYVATGDLVELLPERGFRILGRRRNVLKLASGEHVAPEELERCYARSALVEAVVVLVTPAAERVTALVVPASPELGEEEVLADLRRLARRDGRRASEVPAAIVLAPRVDGALPWTVENGLLTPTLKPDRRALERHYAAALAANAARADARLAGGAGSRVGGAGSSTLDTLQRLVGALLSCAPAGIDPRASFLELGGDSLLAMAFDLRVGEVFGTAALGADDESLATLPLAELARRLESSDETADSAAGAAPTTAVGAAAAHDRSTVAPSASTVAGERPVAATPPVVDAAAAEAATAERLAALVHDDAAEPVGPAVLPPPASGDDVLVTGANGFLGAHLVAHLHATLPPRVRIWALVRAGSDAHAARRVQEALRGYELAGASEVVAAETSARGGRLLAIAGDVGREGLGLPPAHHALLARDVGLIYHVAGEVSAERGYAELREANVLGTRRVLELATDTTLKAVHFVSSLNVLLLLRHAVGPRADERTPLPARLSPELVARSLGYAVSKWAAERLVGALAARAAGAWRCSISRPALLVWSSATGIGNDDDWLARVLRTCLELRATIGPDEVGIPRWAPETARSARGLDLVPVDFAAAAIASLGARTRDGSLVESAWSGEAPIFHVSNTAPDEAGLVGLPQLMDRLLSAVMEVDPARWCRARPLAEWALLAEENAAAVVPVLRRLRGGFPQLERTPAARFAAASAPCPPFDQAFVDLWVRRRLDRRE